MALILNIDTATEFASVCLSNNNQQIAYRENQQQKEHASFIHVAIQAMLQEAAISLNELDAVAVTSGPGSYTGLRVGMATAKGLCYALKKPLITVGTLEVMTKAAVHAYSTQVAENTLYCPMIDARRMEVFTAVFDKSFNIKQTPSSLVLDASSYAQLLENHPIIFFGSGSRKYAEIATHQNALFKDVQHNATHLSTLAYVKLNDQTFADIAYVEPDYLKPFYSTIK